MELLISVGSTIERLLILTLVSPNCNFSDIWLMPKCNWDYWLKPSSRFSYRVLVYLINSYKVWSIIVMWHSEINFELSPIFGHPVGYFLNSV